MIIFQFFEEKGFFMTKKKGSPVDYLILYYTSLPLKR